MFRLANVLLFLVCANETFAFLNLFANLKLKEINKEFHFPTIPYEQGMQNIHILEHLLNMNKAKFQIYSTTEPVTYGEYIITSAKCSIKSLNRDIRMFSNQPNVSYVVCLKEGVPQVTFKLQVAPTFYGHLLKVQASTYLQTPLWKLAPLWSFMAGLEDVMMLKYNLQHDDNLTKYRKLIFNCTAPMDHF